VGDATDPAHAAFNWWAPELWRRFTITLRRVLARRLGLTVGELAGSLRLSFVKVAEFQRRGVVHFHALIRLDGSEPFTAPAVIVGAEDLAASVRRAASSVRPLVSLGGETSPTQAVPRPSQRHPEGSEAEQEATHYNEPGLTRGDAEDPTGHADRGIEQIDQPPPLRHTTPHSGTVPKDRGTTCLRFGEQIDVQVIGGGISGELTAERAAAYIAKYATKSAEDFGLGDRGSAVRHWPATASPHTSPGSCGRAGTSASWTSTTASAGGSTCSGSVGTSPPRAGATRPGPEPMSSTRSPGRSDSAARVARRCSLTSGVV
jgi:hypothetical protein